MIVAILHARVEIYSEDSLNPVLSRVQRTDATAEVQGRKFFWKLWYKQ